MVENGLVFAVNKAKEKRVKKELSESKKHEKLIELLKKYSVNFEDKFSIKNWSKSDLLLLEKTSPYKMTLITLNDNDKIKFTN